MSSSFVHTTRSLDRERSGALWLWPALVLALGWIAWLLGARVDVSASAQRARLEVDHMAHRVAAQTEGRIVRLHCTLGRWVAQGEVLAELDSSLEQAQLQEATVELGTLEQRTAALRRQIAAERARRTSRLRMDEVATEQAVLGLTQARVVADQKLELAKIARELDEQNALSRIDAVHAEVELSGSRVQLSDAALQIDRTRAARSYEDKLVLARIAELARGLAELEAERDIKRAAISRIEAVVERRKVVAPSEGRLGNIAPLQVGDVVKAGDVIATVIPHDDVRVVAEFKPEVAVGRILPNQTARVRLHGFSWLEFGTIDATVRKVASEPHDGTIRVELTLPRSSALATRIPLQHGLPGSVDVQIDRAAPWSLLLRSVGSALTGDRDRVAAAELADAREPAP